jgi:acid phosphatase
LLLIGDQGMGGSAQGKPAMGLANVARDKQPQAIFGTGDNIYSNGAEGSYTKLVDRFTNEYITPFESLQVPWYLVTGNHDWHTDAKWEKDFTWAEENTGRHWNMPHFWYKQDFTTANGVTVDVFFVDTQVWIQRDGSTRTVEFLGSNAKQEQYEWLANELASSSAEWKIVVGHHPIYSQGNKGMTSELHERHGVNGNSLSLDALMRTYGVQLYINGHSHNQQIIQWSDVNYIVTGAASNLKSCDEKDYPRDSSVVKCHDSNKGFAGLSVCSGSQSVLTFYGMTDDVGGTTVLSTHTLSSQKPTPSSGENPCLAIGKNVEGDGC